MASSSDILLVRNNSNELDRATVTDDYLSLLIDDVGVTGATAILWSAKAARYSEEVDVTEAGASHKFSDLFTHAKLMAELWKRRETDELVVSEGRVRVKVIDRQ